ncbi:MAG: hypothetical protein WCD28_12940 [Nitrososphaeraceae archaeon]
MDSISRFILVEAAFFDRGAYINGIGPRGGEKKRSNYLACNSHEENTIGHGKIPAS